jgi:predicted phage-related endonuclease
MNDQNDFAPEVRNSAWWSGDSRMAASGRLVEAIMTKQGKHTPEDISDRENVRMGHVMEPIIGRLASDRLNLEIKEAKYALSHQKEAWLRSHFDFITTDGTHLIEAKNYNSNVRKKFDVETNRVPQADYAQCLHEAVVHNVSKVSLAVLFGGQELQIFQFDFTDQEKEDFIKTSAQYWSFVQTDQIPTPETVEQAKLVYSVGTDEVITASQQVEQAIAYLRQVKDQISAAEKEAEKVELQIRNLMGTRGEIRSVDGTTLVTWRNAKPSMKFNPTALKTAYPDMYNRFVMEVAGSRRFLIK